MKQLATPILILIIPIQKKWFDDSFVKEMIRAVDKSEVLSSHAIESPVLGIIPTSKLSGGVKALILVYKKPELLIDCTACGENCAEWILKIPELGKVFYACTGRTYEGDRTGISQEKIKQTVSLCQSDENIIKVFTGQ